MRNNIWSRRSFLKACFGGVCLLYGQPALARRLESEDMRQGALALYNVHTRESLKIEYRDPSGNYDPEALNSLNQFFRCHYTQRVQEMDRYTIEFLNTIDKQLGGGHEIHIISGYRSPEYNNLLIREGRGVAKSSLHLVGKAIDWYIPGISLERLRETAKSLAFGGIGYYPRSGFIHIDSGRFRTW